MLFNIVMAKLSHEHAPVDNKEPVHASMSSPCSCPPPAIIVSNKYQTNDDLETTKQRNNEPGSQ